MDQEQDAEREQDERWVFEDVEEGVDEVVPEEEMRPGAREVADYLMLGVVITVVGVAGLLAWIVATS